MAEEIWLQMLPESKAVPHHRWTKQERPTFWLTKGVPQGSSLSPLLFSIFIHSLLCALDILTGIKVQAYADDKLNTSVGESTATCAAHLEMALQQNERWCTDNKMKFAQQKSAHMHFLNTKQFNSGEQINFGGQRSQSVTKFRVFGSLV